MRVGLVRRVGLGAVALLAVGFAGCNENPLTFEVGVAYLITTNPSSMTVPAGVTRLLESRTVDEGNRPTWDDVSWEIDATCGGAAVTVETAATYEPEVQPPGVFDVTGGTTIGTTCITLSGGGVEASVAVTVVGDSIEVTAETTNMIVLSQQQLTATLLSADGTPVSPFDQATDITWSSDNDAIVSVDAAGVATAQGAGVAIVTATWTNAGVTVTGDISIAVEVPVPVLTSLDVASAATGETVTITGVDFISGPHEIFIDGVSLADLGGAPEAYAPTIVDGTTATFRMPVGPGGGSAGVVDVQVGSLVAGLSNALPLTDDGDATEPGNDVPGALSLGGLPIALVGWVGPGDFDDFFLFDVAADATLDLFMDWIGGSGDLDLLIDDSGLGFSFPCGFPTATAAHPESGQCALTAGTYTFWVDSYDGLDGIYYATAAVAP